LVGVIHHPLMRAQFTKETGNLGAVLTLLESEEFKHKTAQLAFSQLPKHLIACINQIPHYLGYAYDNLQPDSEQ
jgi:hypothetical protein